MGYWWPPLPDAYSPAKRPLRYRIEGGLRFPLSPEDKYFGVGWSEVAGEIPPSRLRASWTGTYADAEKLGIAEHFPQGLKEPLHIEGDKPGDRYLSDDYNWPLPSGFQKNRRGGAAPGWRPMKSPYQRLRYFHVISNFLERAFGESALPADEILEGGAITLYYVDAANENMPFLKRVTYAPHGAQLTVRVLTFNPDTQAWDPEGFDAERDFVAALPDIIKGFVSVTSALVAALTANPLLSGAWMQLGGQAASAALGGPPPSLAAFAETAAKYLGSAPGASDAFGKVMGNVASPFSKTEFVRSLQGAIATAGPASVAYLDRLKKTVTAYQSAIPKLDFVKALDLNVIPKELTTSAGASGAFLAAVKAFKLQDPNYTLALRMGAPDPVSFDASLASLEASAPIPQRGSRVMVTDPSTLSRSLEQRIRDAETARAIMASKGNQAVAEHLRVYIEKLRTELGYQKIALKDTKARERLYTKASSLLARYGAR